ncbi:unnamed protein product [Cuscuta europaea]|uniref:Uncharacterized protein n=1 Tax=Cuscuta europaea TaxID=41803 RepID=A0A9P0ZCV9_CUSEU|nr:unnamed protein product [Cuscuta europaea]
MKSTHRTNTTVGFRGEYGSDKGCGNIFSHWRATGIWQQLKQRRACSERTDPDSTSSGFQTFVDHKNKGRTNHVELEVLPQGKWPEWCRYCSGSGLSDCSRCLGTGKYRHTMGFDFMYS